MAVSFGKESITNFFKELENDMHKEEGNAVAQLLGMLERKTGVPRSKISYGIGVVFGIYLIIGYFAAIVCNFVGFVFPAYASMKALRTQTLEDDTQWLTYWTIFAIFSFVDFAAEKICSYFPFYWLVKCGFLLWLYLPQTRGAEKLWRQQVEPLFERFEGRIDAAIDEVANKAKGRKTQ